MTSPTQSKSGYVALIGRPNVGKSTLLNRILDQKISITSPKQQTTRCCIRGIKTEGLCQTIYVDTPGVQQQIKKPLNRYMNRQATRTVPDMDVTVWLLDRCHWTADDQHLCQSLQTIKHPIILAINKIDRLSDKKKLLPHIARLNQAIQTTAIIPLSAKTGYQIDRLESEIKKHLPIGEPLFPKHQHTDQSALFMTAELIREAMLTHLHQELPYASHVQIEQFHWRKKTKKHLVVHALIWVENERQKKIIIGKGGLQLKTIATQARQSMAKHFKAPVYLKVWVKIRPGWSNDPEKLFQSTL